MQHGDSGVERSKHIAAKHLAFGLIEIVVAVDRAHIHLRALLEQLGSVAVVLHVGEGAAGVPAAVFGDIDGNHIIFVAIHGGHCLVGRYYRNFMLGGAAAEKYCDIGFHYLES